MRICVLFTKTSLQNCILLAVATHVETVCLLGNTNRKPDDHLKVNIDVDRIHEILDKEEDEGGKGGESEVRINRFEKRIKDAHTRRR